MKQRKLTRPAVLATAIAAVALAGVGYAAIPSTDGTISACKSNKGALKVIDAEAGQACPDGQQLLTWNQQGPAGPAGAPGISGREVVTVETAVGASSFRSQNAYCPPGKAVLGGGGWVTNEDHNVGVSAAALSQSMPIVNSDGVHGWKATAYAPVVDPYEEWRLVVYAICSHVG